jgi:copper ion binding protein
LIFINIILGGIKMKKKILVEGMSCGHCVNHVKEALSELNGVTSVDVNLAAKTAVIEASVDVKDEDIKFAIDDAGYEVAGIEVL